MRQLKKFASGGVHEIMNWKGILKIDKMKGIQKRPPFEEPTKGRPPGAV
jgi:hypothetical protein